MSISTSFLIGFDDEANSTRKTLERIPEDKFAFKPHEKSMSMIELATHIANVFGWGILTLTQDAFDMQPPGSAPYKQEPAKSVTELLDKFEHNAAAFRTALAEASDDHLRANWSLLKGGAVVFTMPRIACIHGEILNHIVHHRAQLGVYLRMNDVPVPAIYGPSADEGVMGM